MKENYEKNVTVESIIKNFNLKVPKTYRKQIYFAAAPDGASSKETDSDSDKEMSSAQKCNGYNQCGSNQFKLSNLHQNDFSVNNPEISENIIVGENFMIDVSSSNDWTTKNVSKKKRGKIEDTATALISWFVQSTKLPQSTKQMQDRCAFNSHETEEQVLHLKSNSDISSTQIEKQNELFEFSIKFLTECFPLQNENDIRNYLLHYDEDLLKTVDHLSHITYVSDKPGNEDIMKLDDVKDTLYCLNKPTQNSISQNSTAGEITYYDITNGETVNIVIDPRLGKELMERFGSGDDYGI